MKLFPVIKLVDVVKHYQSGTMDVLALNKINLSILPGELVSIVGSSGSGKSTLLNILVLLDRPTSGEYFLSEREVSHLSDDELSLERNLKIGFVFQSFFLLPRLTALQNVMMPLLYRDTPKEQAKEKSLTLLEKLNIAHLHHHKPNQLSGGQQQRVALARALVGEPEVILADEPTGALDTHTSQEVLNLFLELNEKENKTVIIVTHDLEIAHECPRIIKVQDGKILSDYTEKVGV